MPAILFVLWLAAILAVAKFRQWVFLAVAAVLTPMVWVQLVAMIAGGTLS